MFDPSDPVSACAAFFSPLAWRWFLFLHSLWAVFCDVRILTFVLSTEFLYFEWGGVGRGMLACLTSRARTCHAQSRAQPGWSLLDILGYTRIPIQQEETTTQPSALSGMPWSVVFATNHARIRRWMLNACSCAEVDGMIRGKPFLFCGLRGSYRLACPRWCRISAIKSTNKRFTWMLLSQVWQMTDALSEPIIIMNIFFWWHSPFSDDGNLPQNASLHAFGWTSCSPHGFTEIVCGTMHAERLHTHHRRGLANHYCYTAMGQYRALPKYGRWTPLPRGVPASCAGWRRIRILSTWWGRPVFWPFSMQGLMRRQRRWLLKGRSIGCIGRSSRNTTLRKKTRRDWRTCMWQLRRLSSRSKDPRSVNGRLTVSWW